MKTITGVTIQTDNKLVERHRMHGNGVITQKYGLSPQKSMCAGCEDDYYNDHNPYGVKECWNFKSSEVVNKVGHSSIHVCGGPSSEVVNKVGHSSIHVCGGPDTIMVKTLSCWHGVCK